MKRGEVQEGQRFRYVYASGKPGLMPWTAHLDECGIPYDRYSKGGGRFDDVDPDDEVVLVEEDLVERSNALGEREVVLVNDEVAP